MALTTSFLLFFVSIVLISESATSTEQGSECRGSICYQKKGFIQYNGGQVTRWTLRSQNDRFTTFVLVLKEVHVPYDFVPWLRVTQHRYTFNKEHEIENGEGRLLVFKETNQVTISVVLQQFAHFKIYFYVGCEVSESGDVNIVKQSARTETPIDTPPVQPQYSSHGTAYYNRYPFNLFQRNERYFQPRQPVQAATHSNFGHGSSMQNLQTPTCWIVIPTITEEIERTPAEKYYISLGYKIPIRTRNVIVEQTYLSFQNVTMSNETTVQATDMLMGTSLMLSSGNNKVLVATLPKNETNSLIYKPEQTITSLVLVELSCKKRVDCNQAEFNFAAKALQQSDIDCVERELKCRFNIGPKYYNCTPPILPPELLFKLNETTEEEFENANCPAFHKFFGNIKNSVETILPDDDNSTLPFEEEGSGYNEGSGIDQRKFPVTGKNRRVHRKLQQCNAYVSYCSHPCVHFYRWGCGKMCLLLKLNNRLCAFFRTAIFA